MRARPPHQSIGAIVHSCDSCLLVAQCGASDDYPVDCGAYDNIGWISAKALRLWPIEVPITFVDFEVGVEVHTGATPPIIAQAALQTSSF